MMDATQLALEQRVAEEQRHHPKGQFLWVWAALLIMTGIEVYLAYQNMELVRMLSILMGLSLMKAGLIIGYFMHLKFESLGHEMGYHEFAGILPGHDAGFLARRIIAFCTWE